MAITEKPTTKELDALQRIIPILETCKNAGLALFRRHRPELSAGFNRYYARYDKLYVALLHGDLTWGEFNTMRRKNYADLLTNVNIAAHDAQALRLQRLQTLPKTTTSSCNWIGSKLKCRSRTY